MRVVILAAVAAILATGCASTLPQEPPDIIYRAIPEALTQPCTLPQMPEDTAELSDAFVQAYKCGELGNADKAAIRELVKP